MLAHKLEKEVKLYKNQFDRYMEQLLHGNKLDRESIELDHLMFKMEYMIRNQKDLDKLDSLRDEFTKRSIDLRDMFGAFMYDFVTQIIGIPKPFKLDQLVDIISQDVKIDSTYITFKMIIVSTSIEFLRYLDKAVPDGDVFNIFPGEYFRFYTDSYNDAIAKAYPELFENRHVDGVGAGADGDVFCHNFTFQVGEGCSLNCQYCYQGHKSPLRMPFSTAKEFIDHLLNDDYGYINRYNSPAIIIEFIGGEPLLYIHLIREIYEHFLDRCYEMNHPWFKLHRLSICSNGMQYFDPPVQEFFKLYSRNVSFNISIDGNRELHDACRIQPNGEGSYDVDMMALNHYNKHYASERNSKMTLAPSNIKYLFESVVDFIKQGMTCININCIFEEGWTTKTALTEYVQLKKLADYLLDNDLEHLYIAIFNERQEDMQSKYSDGNFCGGLSSMLALRPNGQFYPCIRYMPTSVGDRGEEMCIGTVRDGLVGREQGSEILAKMDNITRRSQSNDICYECPIGNDCAWCSALGYTVFGTPNKRPTFACIQMIAEALANVYYWNLLNIKHPEYQLGVRENMVPDEWAKLIIAQHELEFLKQIEAYSMLVTIVSQKRDNND